MYVNAPIVSPVSTPTPVVPAGPISPSQPPGPSANQPDGSTIGLQPTIKTGMLTPWGMSPATPTAYRPAFPQVASVGRSIDGRPVPLNLGRGAGMPHRRATHPGSRADQVTQRKLNSAALAKGLPSTPQEDLRYRGGRTIKDLTYLNIFIGGPNRWTKTEQQWIDYGLEAAMTDPNLNHVVMQYFQNQPVSAEFRGSFWMSGYNPQRVTSANVKQLAKSLYTKGAFNDLPLQNTIINFFLPPGAILEDPSDGGQEFANLAKSIPVEDEANSADGLGGYHGSVHIGSTTVYYAVMVYSERKPDGSHNGIPAFAENWKSIVATAYHELHEARTDPDVDDAITTGQERYLGWTSDRGEEIADFPVDEASPLSLVFREVPLTDGTGKVPVQLLYSNAVHGPEGPIPQPHAGPTLPPAKRRTSPPGTTPIKPNPSPNPNPTPPANPNEGLQRVEQEWSRLPDAVKQQILELINTNVQSHPAF